MCLSVNRQIQIQNTACKFVSTLFVYHISILNGKFLESIKSNSYTVQEINISNKLSLLPGSLKGNRFYWSAIVVTWYEFASCLNLNM